ncbi:MAG: NAD-dependent epimerase/dehydratase family protein [Bacteroidetes bacterium]|nr:NAD-dependent epimerase/dehydratase family protein [Bacteroidota bacterium]
MKILVTGGAGFIGSNLVESLLNNPKVGLVRVLDNLATGHLRNIQEFIDNSKFEFFEGDIRDKEICIKATIGIDAISHQAALGSVPRSIKDPITSHDVNVNGFLNILEAAKVNHVKRIVYASSSSVYGDLNESPKVEKRVGKVLSPYAATKMTNELYAEAYAKNYDMQIIGFRYFNVFGPKQDPEGPYAAVIPLFIKAALTNSSPLINGDGSITRDFTPVSNVVQLNATGLLKVMEGNFHHAINVACGQTTDLNVLWSMIKNIAGATVEANHGPNRKGDILFSLADITLAKEILDYKPDADLSSALSAAIEDYKIRFSF